MHLLLKISLVGSLLATSSCFLLAEEEAQTRLLSVPSLEAWTPPVVKEKVLEPKQVVQRHIIADGRRHICVERCATETVVRKKTKTTDSEAAPEEVTNLEVSSEHLPPLMVGVSASVYKEGEKVFSKVQVTIGQDTVTAWSSVDFNHFRGVSTYVANGREYYQVGGYGEGEFITASEAGCPVNAPEFNGAEDGFVVKSPGGIDETNVAYIALHDMHTLYAKEKDLLEKAYEVRLKNMKLHQAWKEANPPQPKDITIRFWKVQFVEEEEK